MATALTLYFVVQWILNVSHVWISVRELIDQSKLFLVLREISRPRRSCKVPNVASMRRCLCFFLQPLLLPAAAVVILLGRKGRFNANRQKCPTSAALVGSGALFWRALGQKEKRGSEEPCGLPQANFRL